MVYYISISMQRIKELFTTTNSKVHELNRSLLSLDVDWNILQRTQQLYRFASQLFCDSAVTWPFCSSYRQQLDRCALLYRSNSTVVLLQYRSNFTVLLSLPQQLHRFANLHYRSNFTVLLSLPQQLHRCPVCTATTLPLCLSSILHQLYRCASLVIRVTPL